MATRGRNLKPLVNEYCRLHLEGMSVYKIAALFNKKPNSVLRALQYRGVLRPALGRDAEERAAQFFESQGRMVVRQKGDCTFDFLLDGKRVNVKSANLSSFLVKNKPRSNYYFSLKHKKTIFSDYHKEVDLFCFVFLSHERIPMYFLESSKVNVKGTLSIPKSLNTKYPIVLIGHLEQ